MRITAGIVLVGLFVVAAPVAHSGCHEIVPDCAGPLPPGPVPVDLPGGFFRDVRGIAVAGQVFVVGAVTQDNGTAAAGAEAEGAVVIWLLGVDPQAASNATVNVTIDFSDPNEGIDWTGDPDHSFAFDVNGSEPEAVGSPFAVAAAGDGGIPIPVTITIDGESVSDRVWFEVAEAETGTPLPGAPLVLLVLAGVAVLALRRRRAR